MMKDNENYNFAALNEKLNIVITKDQIKTYWVKFLHVAYWDPVKLIQLKAVANE